MRPVRLQTPVDGRARRHLTKVLSRSHARMAAARPLLETASTRVHAQDSKSSVRSRLLLTRGWTVAEARNVPSPVAERVNQQGRPARIPPYMDTITLTPVRLAARGLGGAARWLTGARWSVDIVSNRRGVCTTEGSMPENLPYLVSPGTVATALQKIRAAATPNRFTQDFLANTLGMKGGSPKPIIPFFKRIGFLGTDAAPTDLYKAFRNTGQSGAAVAQAMRIGYKPLFDMNVRAHDLSDSELKGLVVQATGLEEKSRVVQLILQTFKILKQQASFGAAAIDVKKGDVAETRMVRHHQRTSPGETTEWVSTFHTRST